MSASDVGQEVMGYFGDLAASAHLTIVLGAGASAPSGLPNWDEFAKRLAVSSKLVPDENAAGLLLRNQEPVMVLEAARVRSGKKWGGLVQSALYQDTGTEVAPSSVHYATADHYQSSPDGTTLATLNFDGLLEQALVDAGAGNVYVGVDPSHVYDGVTVHHLHGVVLKGFSYFPIVTFGQYAELVADPEAWQRKFLSDALERGPILLVGTTFRDPDIRQWLYQILTAEEPVHPVFVMIIRQGLDLSVEEFRGIEGALTEEWQSIGLTALRVHDYADAAILIRELQFAGGEGYSPPQDRVRNVWSAHACKFIELQDEYSAALLESAQKLGTALEAETVRAALWLADGQGNLVKWASAEARYLDSTNLKRVPTGHDSPYIAGEALAAEELVIKDVERGSDLEPTWKSVLAIPVFTGDDSMVHVATGVVTVGLSEDAENVTVRSDQWLDCAMEVGRSWDVRLNDVAYRNGRP